MCSKKSILFATLLISLSIFFLSLSQPTQISQAQSSDVVWDTPVNLSNTPSSSVRPAIAADPWGQIHVFWSEKRDGRALQPGDMSEFGDTIYYSKKKDGSWSLPVDLFFTDFGTLMDPEVVVDSHGNIHLFWVGPKGIYYSRSSALTSELVRSWEKATVILADSNIDQVEATISHSDQIYVIYNRFSRNNSLGLIRSENGGEDWTHTLVIQSIIGPKAQYPLTPQIVLDIDNRLHVFWTEGTGPPLFTSLGLYYSRSVDQGSTWSIAQKLAESVSGIQCVTIKRETLLAVIIGSEVHRYYIISADDGKSWTQPQQIFGDLLSRAGWDAMAVDSAGIAHLIAQLRYPVALYSSYWNDGWQDPPRALITSDPLNQAHYPQMVISEGNQIHVVMEHHIVGEIWYLHGVSPAPHLATTPLPDITQSPSSTPTQVAMIETPVPRATNIALPNIMGNEPAKSIYIPNLPSGPLIISSVAVLLVIGLSMYIKKGRG